MDTDGRRLHKMARTQFQRTREALRHRQSCREALAVTNSTDSLLALAWTTWVAVHKLKLATKHVRRLVQAEAAQRAQLCRELHGRDGTTHWCGAQRGSLEERETARHFFFQCAVVDQTQQLRLRSFLCGPRENGGREGVEAKWPRSDQRELQRRPLATPPTPMKKLLRRISKELAKGIARRVVPPCSIPREIWLMMLRPRDPDIQETNRPIVTDLLI